MSILDETKKTHKNWSWWVPTEILTLSLGSIGLKLRPIKWNRLLEWINQSAHNITYASICIGGLSSDQEVHKWMLQRARESAGNGPFLHNFCFLVLLWSVPCKGFLLFCERKSISLFFKCYDFKIVCDVCTSIVCTIKMQLGSCIIKSGIFYKNKIKQSQAENQEFLTLRSLVVLWF